MRFRLNLLPFVAFLIVLACALRPGAALAQPAAPSLLDDHVHTALLVNDGAPADVWTMEQAPNGVLWLGTGMGVYRFDGLRFERYPLRDGQRLPSSNINALKVMPDGTLWIGFYGGGVARLREGVATLYGPGEGLPAGRVLRFASTPDGTLWAASGGGLSRLEGERWSPVGETWGLPDLAHANYVYTDRRGVLWVATTRRLMFLPPGATRFLDSGRALSGEAVIAEDREGRLWLSNRLQGTGPIADLTAADTSLPPPPPLAAASDAPPFALSKQFLFARDGSVWLTVAGSGVWRLPSAAAIPTGRRLQASDHPARFERQDGLASPVVVPVLEDVEAGVWVGSNAGLLNFRKKRLHEVAALSAGPVGGFALTPLDRGVLAGSQETAVIADPPAAPRPFPGPLPSRDVITAGDGALWWIDGRAVVRWAADATLRFPMPDSAAPLQVGAFVPDGDRGVWVSLLGMGIFNADRDGMRRDTRFDALPPPHAMTLAPDRSVWLGYDDAVIHWTDGHIRHYGLKDGVLTGRAASMLATRRHVLVAGETGVARLDGERFAAITEIADAAFGHVTGIAESTDGDLWLNGGRGVVHIQADDAQRLFADPSGAINHRLFDRRDGLPGIALQAGQAPTAVRDARGRIWFATNRGVAWLDPASLPRNDHPPRTEIQGVRAGERNYLPDEDLALPQGIQSVTLRFTAITLASADRARFRYRLDGVDRDWHDGGTLRDATYANLTPGRYRFRVVASNSDGVWDPVGASLAFSIAPTLVQTRAFAVFCVVALALLIWVIYRVRTRAIERQVQMRMEERHRERERIARELHDTLLQGVQGLVLQFASVARRVVEPETHHKMDRALGNAETLIAAARDRVSDLRGPDSGPLGPDLTRAANEWADDSLQVRVIISGDEQPLRPAVRDELLMIAREALSNAARHARAEAVTVELHFEPARLSLRVHDDGIGLDPAFAGPEGRQGHHGIRGMFERAARLRGSLSLHRPVDGGTEVEVRLSGARAYPEGTCGPLNRLRAWLAARKPPRDAQR